MHTGESWVTDTGVVLPVGMVNAHTAILAWTVVTSGKHYIRETKTEQISNSIRIVCMDNITAILSEINYSKQY